ncbi:perlucin-like protein, partial [Boleophthalmus pectinirostris]|uniref:perlucin-like protein n=1 Tax=Boleophthalmus pectinirostris TaxID=150288 RepID=UPI00242B0FC1
THIFWYILNIFCALTDPRPKPPSQGTSNVRKRVIIGILIGVLVLAVIGVVAVTSVPCTYQCDSGWELNGTKCYYFSTNKLTWTQSEEECVTLGGHLVKINSREEQSFLYKRLRDLMTENEDKFWIGLTDSESEGVWKWTDGSLLDTNLTFWFKNGAQTEPDNWTYNNKYPEGEDCVRMGEKTDGYEYKCWFDKHCNTLQRYICEKNPNCIK